MRENFLQQIFSSITISEARSNTLITVVPVDASLTCSLKPVMLAFAPFPAHRE